MTAVACVGAFLATQPISEMLPVRCGNTSTYDRKSVVIGRLSVALYINHEYIFDVDFNHSIDR